MATLARPLSASAGLSSARTKGYTSAVKTMVTMARPVDSLEADHDVIARVLAGDRNAFGVLIGRYSDPLYRHALGMTGSPDVAEDILQASFIKAYQHLAEVHGRFDAWIFRIVANGCKDWLKNIRRTHLSYEEDDQPSAFATPDEELDRTELRSDLDRALAARVPSPTEKCHSLVIRSPPPFRRGSMATSPNRPLAMRMRRATSSSGGASTA